MNASHQLAVVFANRNAARTESTQLIEMLVGMGVVVLIVWVLSYFSDGRRRPASYRSPGRLFLALARAHRLTWWQIWLLWRLARWRGLKDPARLFLEPQWFDREGLSRRLARRAARLRLLRSRLFAGLSEAETQASAPVASGGLGLPIGAPGSGTV